MSWRRSVNVMPGAPTVSERLPRRPRRGFHPGRGGPGARFVRQHAVPGRRASHRGVPAQVEERLLRRAGQQQAPVPRSGIQEHGGTDDEKGEAPEATGPQGARFQKHQNAADGRENDA